MGEQPPVRRVMISSTALDLPEHRRQASDACLRMSMLPLAMEQMPASPVDALTLSRRYVDQADFYLGIFAFRYGFIPEGQEKSLTELEYERAFQRAIPTFIFIADTKHPVSFEDVERGGGAPKLDDFKERLRKAHVVRTFSSAEELRTEIISALSDYRQDDVAKLHYIAEIPRPPTPWVAHWYSLLGNRGFVGRREELKHLTDWVAGQSTRVFRDRLLALVAIGGMGKSALAWTWWNEIAPHEMKPLAGRMWWSFYESDARFENFTERALAYLTGKPRAVTERIPARDREAQLLTILNREPHLVVLDGVERELVAYARLDAAHLLDDDLDAKTAHSIPRRKSRPGRTVHSFAGEAKLRRTANPHTGQFLCQLARVSESRILITTRLFPFELQDEVSEQPLLGTSVRFLPGLSDDDALELWRSAGLTGARDMLVSLFRSFDGHPLLVRALAGEILRDRKNPGDFEKWRMRHPDFNPFAMPLVQRKSHVLDYALRGLTPQELTLLRTIAGFRMPASYETLAAVLVKEAGSVPLAPHLSKKIPAAPPFATDEAFDRALADLDDRGLVGWDRRANRYDLHPIVRGVVWSGASNNDRGAIAERMLEHFAPMPVVELAKVERLEDLTPAIELYVSLVRLERFDEAVEVFRDRLHFGMSWRLGASRLGVELLEMLFPDGIDGEPRPMSSQNQSYTLSHLAGQYELCGQPGRAVPCYQRALVIDDSGTNRADVLTNLSAALRVTGALRAARASAFRALATTDDDSTRNRILGVVGTLDATRNFGDLDSWLGQSLLFWEDSLYVSRRTLQWRAEVAKGQFDQTSRQHSQGDILADLAQLALWRGNAVAAMRLAKRAWDLAKLLRAEHLFIRPDRLQGEAALRMGSLDRADVRLVEALTRARAFNDIKEELAALTALATLHRLRHDTLRALEYLDGVWDAAERGPYPLRHADARNVLAEIQIAEKNVPAAIAAATAAYRLAWCDGPPFAYDYGLRTARAHLHALGAPEPEMPPYDASKHEPIDEIDFGGIDIEPDGEQTH